MSPTFAYAIVWGRFGKRRYLRIEQPSTGTVENGWRPQVWTRDVALAEKFDTDGDARDHAARVLPHDDYSVVIVPPRARPGEDRPGGTPVMQAAGAGR